MKKLLTACLFAAGMLPLAAQTTATSLQPYFEAHLQGKALPTVATTTIDDVEAATAEAWQAWRKANAGVEPLVTAALSEARTLKYEIPAELEADATMPFYYGTKGERPAEGYPFFLYMHGSGPKAAEWATGLKLANYWADAPSFYMVPQIPNEGQLYRWWQKGKQWVWKQVLRRAMLDEQLNPNRIYFLGISEGGYGSQRLGSFYADYLAAVGPMAGGEPLRNAPCENLMNTPFSLLTGEYDRMFSRDILTRRALATLDSLEQAHPGFFKHRIALPEGRGHSIDYSPTTPWLAQFERNATPKQFAWENFEMDGIKRNAFYNIKVDKESGAAETRTYYTYETRKNEIHITAQHVTYNTTVRDPQMGIEISLYKTYTPAPNGALTIFLNDDLCNTKKKVRIFVNGKECFCGKLQPTLGSLAESIATYEDAKRVFPYSVKVAW